MSARVTILAAIRQAQVPEVPAPESPTAAKAGEGAADLERRFVEMLRQVGGSAVRFAGPEGMAEAVAAITAADVEPGADVVSCVPGLAVSILTIGPDSSRAELDRIGLAVIPGRFGVAENAAIWVDEHDLPHRALPVVAEHLAIVLPKREIVADMHAAYRRLPRPLPGYGVFISGPSKTADIEQALVIGAQGPKSLVVLLV